MNLYLRDKENDLRGFQRGIQHKEEAIIKKMLRSGFNPKVIEEMTEVPQARIVQIKLDNKL